jgi:hypothetical protein
VLAGTTARSIIGGAGGAVPGFGNIFSSVGAMGGYGYRTSATVLQSGIGASSPVGAGGIGALSLGAGGFSPGGLASGDGAGGGGGLAADGAPFDASGGDGTGGIIIVYEYS